MLFCWWANLYAVGPASKQHWVNALCLLRQADDCFHQGIHGQSASTERSHMWIKITSGFNPCPAVFLLTLKALTICVKTIETEGFFLILKSSRMSRSALSDSFEYPCYGSTAIRNSFTLTVQDFCLECRG